MRGCDCAGCLPAQIIASNRSRSSALRRIAATEIQKNTTDSTTLATSYVVLRMPSGPPDTGPDTESHGGRGPVAASPDAPNYFDAAWRARPYLKRPDGRSPQPDEFALAVNSALTRSQDQLHIHLGCLLPAMNHRPPDDDRPRWAFQIRDGCR